MTVKFIREKAHKCSGWSYKERKSNFYQIMELEGTKAII